MRKWTTALIGLAVVVVASEVRAGEVVDPDPWTELLQTHVDSEGQVDYASWKSSEEDVEKLESYLGKVAEADPEGHDRSERLAFYLNAYNATVIASILDHWPTDSPQSIKGFFKVKTHKVAGTSMTLDELEHELIRPEFGEPRIHFVLVCAAKSCPRLQRRALTSSNLESTLEAAAGAFIPRVTELDGESVVTSSLFDWFGEDFEKAAGSVREYLAKYVEDEELEEALADEEAEIDFHSYDWSVNAQ